MTRATDDALGVMLRQAAALEAVAPRPATEVRRNAEQRRARRRIGSATAALVVTVSAGALVSDAFSPSARLAPAPGTSSVQPTVPTSPAPMPTTAPPTPSSTPSVTGTDAASEDAPAVSGGTQPAWPVPPTTHVDRPWERAGFDYGEIVGARMENGRAVITFDRQQIYTAKQWTAMTGEAHDHDFRTVNASSKTREFTILPGAAIYLDWVYHDPDSAPREKVGPAEFVTRTRELLREQAAHIAELEAEYPRDPDISGGTPGVGVWLFHQGNPDGPVAYLDDASSNTG